MQKVPPISSPERTSDGPFAPDTPKSVSMNAFRSQLDHSENEAIKAARLLGEGEVYRRVQALERTIGLLVRAQETQNGKGSTALPRKIADSVS